MNHSKVRIACTMPTPDSFGGRDYLGAKVIADTLTKMGFQVFLIDTSAFFRKDRAACEQVIIELRDFKPQLAFSLPNAGYALACYIDDGPVRRNIFTDLLEIPLALMWDDPLGQFARFIIPTYPNNPTASQSGMLGMIRSVISHPLIHHFAWDSGHIQTMDSLGLLNRNLVKHRMLFANQYYVSHGQEHSTRPFYENKLSFVGNVYPHMTVTHPLYQLPLIQKLLFDIVSTKDSDITVPTWKVLTTELYKLNSDILYENNLSFDDSFFWNVYEFIVWTAVNTISRMRLIQSIQHEISFYGGFADPEGVTQLSAVDNVLYKGTADYIAELPNVFRSTRITVDVTNQLAQFSAPCKFFECFAAGGFMLLDYKPDIVNAFGEYGEKVSYKSYEDLNDKIDYYLTKDNERLEISNGIKQIINASFTLERWLEYIITEMPSEAKDTLISPQVPRNREINLDDELYLGKSFYKNRLIIAAERPAARIMHDIIRNQMRVGHPGDLPFHEWGQLMAFALEFKPDLILEIGRGYGNSTCAFTHVANILSPGSCRVVSICLSEWAEIYKKLSKAMPAGWFAPLELYIENILTFDYLSILKNTRRVLLFWDAHGYDVAECVLGQILPIIRSKENAIIMHDISDARYQPQTSLYGTYPLWTHMPWEGNDSPSCHLRLGNLYSAVAQAISIYDFSSRNKLKLFTAANSLYSFFEAYRKEKYEILELLHDDMFNLNAGWIWFHLDSDKEYSYPALC